MGKKTRSQRKEASRKASTRDQEPVKGGLEADETSGELEPGEAEDPARDGEPDEPEPSSEDDEDDAEDEVSAAARISSAPTAGADTEAPAEGASWALPLVRIDKGWTWFEARLLFGVLITLIVALCIWISLTGMSSPLGTDNAAGGVFRVLVGGSLLGAAAQLLTRGRTELQRAVVTVVAIIVGASMAPLWRTTGVEYFGGMLNWLQEGSTLTLFGGLRGVATRLTILAALLGASLAAASGKHINIDVVMRFMKPWMRLPVFVLGAVATAAVCIASSWGFFDYISIEGFGTKSDARAGEKVAHVAAEGRQHAFLLRKQMGFDLKALPTVLSGERWDNESRMTGRQWNSWIDEGGFSDHFTKEQIDTIRSDETSLDQPRVPAVVMPGGSTRGLLIHGMNLMFPIGLFIIGLRFLLRALLAIGGWVKIEPEGSAPKPEEEDDDQEADEPSEDAKEAA